MLFSGKGHKFQPIRSEKAQFSRFLLVEIGEPSPIIPHIISHVLSMLRTQLLKVVDINIFFDFKLAKIRHCSDMGGFLFLLMVQIFGVQTEDDSIIDEKLLDNLIKGVMVRYS